ncbi:dsDNA nuclease domain-containing protein [Kosakonia cowanii]|uniref:dsDNA nuclease domain-containing protein n=1 Tax=Kosakonia cowanii TaxID=208223 RepID=UPI0025A9CEE0|nr:dsDNA nuclease domain-containing protein [Kosakonia cowanii]MDM9617845.1 dsDNA nuclease domain-containing protein [Kosakonia cowanii]MDP4562829.1 dsDNA nuclease domain-containing protein [Kosakonia cowanii]
MQDSSSFDKTTSDHGAISSRGGYLYQDYVATNYVLDMLSDRDLIGVRCERIDDIDLIRRNVIEYVQVKSNLSGGIWNLKDVYKLDKIESIVQKSLSSDKEVNVTSLFRIVTKTSVGKSLNHLCISRTERKRTKERETLIKSVHHHLKNKVSSNGNGAEYWVDNCYWQYVRSDKEAIYEAHAKIMKYATEKGISLFSYDVDDLYNKILRLVSEIASRSNRQYNDIEKTFSSQELNEMISNWIGKIANQRRSTKKVYSNNSKPNCFVKIHELESKEIKSKMLAFFSKYGRDKKVRYGRIVDNLFVWLPEFILTPRELAENDSSECFKLWAKTLEKINSEFDGVKKLRLLLSELILYILIRGGYKSEPISGMLYVHGLKGIKQFNNVHIVEHDSEHHLLLGNAFIEDDINTNDAPASLVKFLYDNLDDDIFDSSKARIFDAKHDDYLTSHNVDELLAFNASVSDYPDRYRFTLLYIYNAKCLANGYVDEYQDLIKEEVSKIFDVFCLAVKNSEDNYIQNCNVDIYFLSLEKINDLSDEIIKRLGRNGL